MNSFELWKLINFIIGKDFFSNRISPEEFDLELKAKNLRLLRKRLGFPETYNPGQTLAGVDTTRLSQADVRPFLVDEDRDVVDGIVSLDAWFYIEDFYTESSRTCEIISRQEVSNRVRDPQLKPTSKDVVAHYVSKGLKVYPSDIGSIHILYVRQPKTPVFKVTTGGDMRPAYDETNSVELEWDDGAKLDVLHLILADLGMNTSRAELTNYAETLIKTGS